MQSGQDVGVKEPARGASFVCLSVTKETRGCWRVFRLFFFLASVQIGHLFGIMAHSVLFSDSPCVHFVVSFGLTPKNCDGLCLFLSFSITHGRPSQGNPFASLSFLCHNVMLTETIEEG